MHLFQRAIAGLITVKVKPGEKKRSSSLRFTRESTWLSECCWSRIIQTKIGCCLAKFSHWHGLEALNLSKKRDQKFFFQTKACPSPIERGAGYCWLSACTVAQGSFWKSLFWGHPVFGSGELSEQTWAWTAWCSCRPGSARRSWSPRPRRSPSRTPRHTAGQHRCLASWKGFKVPSQGVTRPGVEPTACFELPAVLVVAHGIATQSVVQASPTLRTCVRARTSDVVSKCFVAHFDNWLAASCQTCLAHCEALRLVVHLLIVVLNWELWTYSYIAKFSKVFSYIVLRPYLHTRCSWCHRSHVHCECTPAPQQCDVMWWKTRRWPPIIPSTLGWRGGGPPRSCSWSSCFGKLWLFPIFNLWCEEVI